MKFAPLAAALVFVFSLSGCSMCDGWFWQKNKSCGDGSAFVN